MFLELDQKGLIAPVYWPHTSHPKLTGICSLMKSAAIEVAAGAHALPPAYSSGQAKKFVCRVRFLWFLLSWVPVNTPGAQCASGDYLSGNTKLQ